MPLCTRLKNEKENKHLLIPLSWIILDQFLSCLFLIRDFREIVFIELTAFLNENELFEKFQSSFRAHHSTGMSLT